MTGGAPVGVPNLPAGGFVYIVFFIDVDIWSKQNCTVTEVRSRTSLWTNPIERRTWNPCGTSHQTEDQNSQEHGRSGHSRSKKSPLPRREARILLHPCLHFLPLKQMIFPASQERRSLHENSLNIYSLHLKLIYCNPTLPLPELPHMNPWAPARPRLCFTSEPTLPTLPSHLSLSVLTVSGQWRPPT